MLCGYLLCAISREDKFLIKGHKTEESIFVIVLRVEIARYCRSVNVLPHDIPRRNDVIMGLRPEVQVLVLQILLASNIESGEVGTNELIWIDHFIDKGLFFSITQVEHLDILCALHRAIGCILPRRVIDQRVPVVPVLGNLLD